MGRILNIVTINQFNKMMITDLEVTVPSHQRIPKTKTQYAAGFRNFNLTGSKVEAKVMEDEGIEKYLDFIGVNNLTDIYRREKEEQARFLNNYSQKQKIAMQKLYKNQYNRNKQQKQDEQAANMHPRQSQISIQWQKDKKFEEAQVQEYLFKKLIIKIEQKLKSEYKNVCKRKYKDKVVPSFMHCFIKFIINSAIDDKQFVSKLRINEDEYLIIGFKSFINSNNLLRVKIMENQLMDLERISEFKHASRFLFCFFMEMQSVVGTQLWETGRKWKQIVQVLSKKDLSIGKWVEQGVKNNNFNSLISHFTIPYDLAFSKKNQNFINQENQQIEEYKFKAKQVPKSTYNQPHKSQIKQSKNIVPQPFNLSETQPKITADQYYYWDTNYKAKQIPKTTYKPEKIVLMSEQEKKAQAFLSLQKASYPKSMDYLNRYSQFANQRRQVAAIKYQKERLCPQRNQMPNFQLLHAKQMILMENTMQKNRKKIQQKPFSLSKNRERKRNQFEIFNYVEMNKSKPRMSRQSKRAKSTKKFDTYVEYRKKLEAAEKQKTAKKEQMEKEKQQKQKKLNQILRERMREQFQAHPIQHPPYEPNKEIKLKIPYQQIYKEKPLLMKSSLPQKQYQLPWEPIFNQL